MKAHIQLETDVDYENNEDVTLVLLLIVHGKKEYVLWRSKALDISNERLCKEIVEDGINESTIITGSIPGLKLKIDDSVADFMDDAIEDAEKFVNVLLREI